MYSLSSHGRVAMNEHAKELLYNIHCKNGAMAINEAGQMRPLSECNLNDVKHIAGMWRIQNKFNQPIYHVRDKDFVLLERINRTEKNLFEFYRASMVGSNCYGRFLVGGADKIVAKYETDSETFWSYGNTIEQARAFLGIRLYDKYMDLIHHAACKNKLAGIEK